MKKKIVALMLCSLLLSTVFIPKCSTENNYGISLAFILDDMSESY